METILRAFLRSHLSSYISSSEDEGSGLSFKGVVFKAEEYPRVERFTAQSLEILVPWAALTTQSIEVHLAGVDLVLGSCVADTIVTDVNDDKTAVTTQGKPWDEGEGERIESDDSALPVTGSWVGTSIRSRLIRSALNLSLYVEDLTFTEDLGTHQATIQVGSLSLSNISVEDWVDLVRNPDGWLGKALVLEELTVLVGSSRLHLGSMQLSSVLPVYEFLAGEDFDYRDERIVPVSVNISVVNLEGEVALLMGWVKDKLAGETKEDVWGVDLGVSIGALHFGDLTLLRVVFLWSDVETLVKADRLGMRFKLGAIHSEFLAEDVEMRVENGMGRIDAMVIRSQGVDVLLSAVEVGWGDQGMNVRAGSVSVDVVVEVLEAILHEENLTEDDQLEGEGSSGGSSGGWLVVEFGMVVLGCDTSDGMVTIWSNGVKYESNQLNMGCVGFDVNGEQVLKVHGIVKVVRESNGWSVRLGGVDIWLVREYLGAIDQCCNLLRMIKGEASGTGVVDKLNKNDVSVGNSGLVHKEASGGPRGNAHSVRSLSHRSEITKGVAAKTGSTMTVEFGAMTVRLGERCGVEEITVVDTRTGKRMVGAEEKVMGSIEPLNNGYSLYQDLEDYGVWWIARPVSFRSLLRKGVRVDGSEVEKDTEVQLYVRPSGGRLCELEVEGLKVSLGVPGWGPAEDEGNWDEGSYDLLVAPPGGHPIELDVGPYVCLLSTGLTSYNRLEITLAPRVLVKNHLWCDCSVDVIGVGVAVVPEGDAIGLDIGDDPRSLFVVEIRNGKECYRSLPLGVEQSGRRVVGMVRGSDLSEEIDDGKNAIVVSIQCAGHSTILIEPFYYVRNDTQGFVLHVPGNLWAEGRDLYSLLRPCVIEVQDRQHGDIHTYNLSQVTECRTSWSERSPTICFLKTDDSANNVTFVVQERAISNNLDTNVVVSGSDGNGGVKKLNLAPKQRSQSDIWGPIKIAAIGELADVDLSIVSNSELRCIGMLALQLERGHVAISTIAERKKSVGGIRGLQAFWEAEDRFRARIRLDELKISIGAESKLSFGPKLGLSVGSASRSYLEISSPNRSEVNYSAWYSQLQAIGFSKIHLPCLDDHTVMFLRTLYKLGQSLVTDERVAEVASSPEHSDVDRRELLVSLLDDIELSGDVALSQPVDVTLQNVRVAVKSISNASVSKLKDHVRAALLRSLPQLLLSWMSVKALSS